MYERGSESRARLLNALREASRFTVTSAHLALLARAQFGWDDGEYYEGGPVIFVGRKRPYGNSSIEQDLAEIIDPDGYDALDFDDPDAWPAYWAEHGPGFLKAHAETWIALMVICQTGQWRTGHFIRPYLGTWEPGPALEDRCTRCGFGAGRPGEPCPHKPAQS